MSEIWWMVSPAATQEKIFFVRLDLPGADQHLGFVVVCRREDAPYTQFLADETGRFVGELYSNPSATIPDDAAGHPLVMHLALFALGAGTVAHRLERAGAKPFSGEKLPEGSRLMFLRDP